MSDGEPCPAHRAMELLQEKWVLHIIRALLDGPKGFNELARATGGCNAVTLSHRLEQLVKLGLVRKTVHSTMPPRTSYRLTRAGRALRGVIRAIDRWARRYLVETA
ncbi:MAG: helix-turn-helix domain-containing protein [Armatimonadota bacterium]|nr:helix-turn-helix domain-containing protein [Armatimonadota bacterium]MDR7570640.1 helix-turn-helix domain-containing protein [Armatimonadota bacterium]MDR7615294.1 helix-turn-helix domain-containing protein [Armatimonadota bacterium]